MLVAAAVDRRCAVAVDAPLPRHLRPRSSSRAGFVLWLAVYESGVHATIAGVVMGLLTPARPLQTELEPDEVVDVLENRAELHADDVRATAA